MTGKKILIHGDYSAKHHTFKEVDKVIGGLFSDGNEVVCTEDYSFFEYDKIKGFDLCIFYSDRWTDTITDAQAQGVIKYVSEGGRLLTVHGGISLHKHAAMKEAFGSEFLGHPARTNMTYEGVGVLTGIAPFELFEEPYKVGFAQGESKPVDMRVTLEFIYEGERYPAAWIAKLGKGVFAYVQPGHDISVIRDENVKDMITRHAEMLM